MLIDNGSKVGRRKQESCANGVRLIIANSMNKIYFIQACFFECNDINADVYKAGLVLYTKIE